MRKFTEHVLVLFSLNVRKTWREMREMLILFLAGYGKIRCGCHNRTFSFHDFGIYFRRLGCAGFVFVSRNVPVMLIKKKTTEKDRNFVLIYN